MFDGLIDSFGKTRQSLKGRGLLHEKDVRSALKEMRYALLDSDVALAVVDRIEKEVLAQALQKEVLNSVTPAQQVIKIVHDVVRDLLGGENASPLNLSGKPAVILMVGLQGSGKTTSSAKLAAWLARHKQQKPYLASLDVYRPAAGEQLQQLAESINVDYLPLQTSSRPQDIAQRAVQAARLHGYDSVILDSAGRTQLDQDLMQELREISAIAKPSDTLLVVDAMVGQDALQSAQGFNEAVDLNGLFFSRLDGDARGGAILSARHATGHPIKFLGVGEKIEDLELFHPERITSRIVGQGDIATLVEKVELSQNEESNAAAERIAKGKFDLNDMLQQLRQLKKMGGMQAMLPFLPSALKKALPTQAKGLDEHSMKQTEAIILSMTPRERRSPKIIHANRRKRIAKGSGTDVRDVNRVLKQFQGMAAMMKTMRNPGQSMPDALAGIGQHGVSSGNPLLRR